MSGDVAEFVAEKLGHKPSDLSLFEAALTHSSSRSENYERLEFLGDRVLGLVIARWLYERFPAEPEGNLSRRFNTLVDRPTCGEIGSELGIPEHSTDWQHGRISLHVSAARPPPVVECISNRLRAAISRSCTG